MRARAVATPTPGAASRTIPSRRSSACAASNSSIAARHARTVLQGVERILAIELLLAAQALELRLELVPGAAPGVGVSTALARIRELVAHLDADREPGPDLAAATALVHDGVLADLTNPADRRT